MSSQFGTCWYYMWLAVKMYTLVGSMFFLFLLSNTNTSNMDLWAPCCFVVHGNCDE